MKKKVNKTKIFVPSELDGQFVNQNKPFHPPFTPCDKLSVLKFTLFRLRIRFRCC